MTALSGKDYFLYAQEVDTFYPPDDIRFEIYSSDIWQKFISELRNKNSDIVDFGCGGGTALHVLEKLGFTNLSGIDYCDIVPPGFIKSFKFFHEDIFNSTLKSGYYDALISSMVIEHVPEVDFVEEVYRVLKPGGIALITSILKGKYAWYWHKNKFGKTTIHPDHIKEYKSINEFCNLFRNKFTIELIKRVPLKYPIIDPVMKFLMNIEHLKFIKHEITTQKFLKKLRLLRVSIPNYYSIEVVVRKV